MVEQSHVPPPSPSPVPLSSAVESDIVDCFLGGGRSGLACDHPVQRGGERCDLALWTGFRNGQAVIDLSTSGVSDPTVLERNFRTPIETSRRATLYCPTRPPPARRLRLIASLARRWTRPSIRRRSRGPRSYRLRRPGTLDGDGRRLFGGRPLRGRLLRRRVTVKALQRASAWMEGWMEGRGEGVCQLCELWVVLERSVG